MKSLSLLIAVLILFALPAGSWALGVGTPGGGATEVRWGPPFVSDSYLNDFDETGCASDVGTPAAVASDEGGINCDSETNPSGGSGHSLDVTGISVANYLDLDGSVFDMDPIYVQFEVFIEVGTWNMGSISLHELFTPTDGAGSPTATYPRARMLFFNGYNGIYLGCEGGLGFVFLGSNAARGIRYVVQIDARASHTDSNRLRVYKMTSSGGGLVEAVSCLNDSPPGAWGAVRLGKPAIVNYAGSLTTAPAINYQIDNFAMQNQPFVAPATPTASPTPGPTATPTPTPAPGGTPYPTPTPTAAPTATPTPTPTPIYAYVNSFEAEGCALEVGTPAATTSPYSDIQCDWEGYGVTDGSEAVRVYGGYDWLALFSAYDSTGHPTVNFQISLLLKGGASSGGNVLTPRSGVWEYPWIAANLWTGSEAIVLHCASGVTDIFEADLDVQYVVQLDTLPDAALEQEARIYTLDPPNLVDTLNCTTLGAATAEYTGVLVGYGNSLGTNELVIDDLKVSYGPIPAPVVVPTPAPTSTPLPFPTPTPDPPPNPPTPTPEVTPTFAPTPSPTPVPPTPTPTPTPAVPTPVPGEPIIIDGETEYQDWTGYGTFLSLGEQSTAQNYREAYRDLGLTSMRVLFSEHSLIHSSGNYNTAVTLVDDIPTNAAKINLNGREAARQGEFAEWLVNNRLGSDTEDRIHVHATLFSPPHWMKVATGASVTYWGWAPCCVSELGAPDPLSCPPIATPWVAYFCNNPPTGNSMGGTLAPTDAMRTNLARYLAAYAYKFNQVYHTGIDSIAVQNEVVFESPFSSCSYVHCASPATGECWNYFADALAKIRDYWILKGLDIEITGPGNGGMGHGGYDSYDIQRQMRIIKGIRDHADAPDLENWLGAYSTNHYTDPTLYSQQQVYDIYNNGWQAVPTSGAYHFEWELQSWINYQLIATGLNDGKPRYYTEAGQFDDYGWLRGAGETPAYGDAFTVALTQQLFHTFGEASMFQWFTFAEDEDETWSDGSPRPRGHLLYPSQLDTPMVSPRYVAAKHFTRYIRPGATRIKAVFDTTNQPSWGGATKWHIAQSTNVIAYEHDVDKDLVVVVTNSQNSSKNLQLRFGTTPTSGAFTWYLSDNTRLWEEQVSHSWNAGSKVLSITVPPYSVSTFVDFNTP